MFNVVFTCMRKQAWQGGEYVKEIIPSEECGLVEEILNNAGGEETLVMIINFGENFALSWFDVADRNKVRLPVWCAEYI